MIIPKCKECEHHILLEGGKDSSYSSLDKNFCYGFKIIDAEGYQTGIEKFIHASKMKTSPKWCPKRVK